MTITSTCTGRATTADGSTWDHGIYVAHAAGVGPHDLLFENIKVDGRGNLASAFHFDHGDAANPPAWNVTVRRLHVTGTQQAIILWNNGPQELRHRRGGHQRRQGLRRPVRVEPGVGHRVQEHHLGELGLPRLLQLDGLQPAGRDAHEQQLPLTGLGSA